IDPNFKYSVVKPAGSDKKYLLATELVKQNAELFGWESYEEVKVVKGKELDKVLAQHPFYPDRKLVTMLGDFVTLDAGTGLV
ncbi:class I tRNA ligase family protein, partial [Bifidobacterium pullorum subsp. saeculare]|uniref:class I tRNA ligase family protein n=1 Tax=Bifidobacterium pullorum TaxID=78448 RepID=UPI00195C41E0